MTDTSPTGQPFDDIRSLIESMPEVDVPDESDVHQDAAILGQDLRPIGRITAPLSRIAAWQGAVSPSLNRPLIAVFAGTHGVAEQLGYENIVEASKMRVARLTEG